MDDPYQLQAILKALPSRSPAILSVELYVSMRVLEIAFVDTTTRDHYVAEGIPLSRSTVLRCVVPPSNPPTLTTYHVERVPPGPRAMHAKDLQDIFGHWGIVHEVRPRIWADTTLTSHSWQVILERRSSDPTVPCTFEFFAPQRSGNELIIERRGVRSVCRFCLNTSHTREGCRHKRPAQGPPAGGNTRTGGSGPRHRRRRPSQWQPKATSSVQAPALDTSSTTTIIPPSSVTSPPASV
jgi:hypothetical protein